MPENLILFLFLGFIFWIIWGILFTLLAKHLKGSIKISLSKRAYNFGESVTGTFELHAKKEITWEALTAYIVGYKRDVSYGKDGKKHTRRTEFARFAQHIESGRMYGPSERKNYNIDITIPSFDDIYWEHQDIDLWDTTFWKIASYALKRTRRIQITWQVQVDLESKGLDLHEKRDIFITQ